VSTEAVHGSDRRALADHRGVAWAAVVLAVSLVGVAGGIWAVDSISGSTVERPFYWEDAAAGLVFPLIGALILHHRPRNRLGWVILVMGLAGAVAIAGEQYAFHGAVAAPGSLPAPEVAAWVTTWVWFPIYGLVPLVLLLFPEGPPDGWWARLVPAAIVVPVVIVVAFGVMTARDPLHFAFDPEADPFAGWSVLSAVMTVGMVAFLCLVVLAIASLVVRWREADALGRQQRKWLVASATFGIACFVLKSVYEIAVHPESPGAVGDLLGVVGVTVMLLGIPIAILRYQLFEIDRILSRTVSYTVLTLALGGLYVLGVFVLGGALRTTTGGGGGDLAVAASTLLVAAAFGPARRRVQSAVDRRFDRARYDARRTIEEFGQKLRDEVEMGRLVDELERVATSAVHPSSTGVWFPRARAGMTAPPSSRTTRRAAG
jgi:hypothetical protein